MKFYSAYRVFMMSVFLLFSAVRLFAQFDNESAAKLSEVLTNIENYYVDEVNKEKLTDAAIVEILMQLDPHSEYFPKDEADELMRNLNGSFEGVGVTYKLLNDTIFVLSTVPGGPSRLAGIFPGDRIIKINNKAVSGVNITSSEIREEFLGAKGTKVEVSVKRRDVDELINKTLVRDEIKPASISASYMISENIGYLKLDRFTLYADKEFEDSLKVLKQSGAEHLILDLRGNSGGYLQTCINIANAFWRGRELIVATRGHNSKERTYETNLSASFHKGGLVVLIDEGSASASEIIAGAVQDLDRGVIVGRRSYGKGLVQRPFYLNDGSLMRLTVAKYYTASGRCIQKEYDTGKANYKAEYIKRNDGEFLPDTGKVYYTKNRRKVYGDGAIYPDIFMPKENEKYSEAYRSLLSGGNLFDQLHLYTDENRSVIETNYTSFETFSEQYDLSEALLAKLSKAVPDSISTMPDSTLSLFNEYDQTHLKALIVRDIWGRAYYHVYLNRFSEMVQAAVGVLSDELEYEGILLGRPMPGSQVWR